MTARTAFTVRRDYDDFAELTSHAHESSKPGRVNAVIVADEDAHGLKRFERLDQPHVWERENEDLVLALADLQQQSFGGFQDADVLPLLPSALQAVHRNLFPDQRLEQFHERSVHLS